MGRCRIETACCGRPDGQLGTVDNERILPGELDDKSKYEQSSQEKKKYMGSILSASDLLETVSPRACVSIYYLHASSALEREVGSTAVACRNEI